MGIQTPGSEYGAWALWQDGVWEMELYDTFWFVHTDGHLLWRYQWRLARSTRYTLQCRPFVYSKYLLWLSSDMFFDGVVSRGQRNEFVDLTWPFLSKSSLTRVYFHDLGEFPRMWDDFRPVSRSWQLDCNRKAGRGVGKSFSGWNSDFSSSTNFASNILLEKYRKIRYVSPWFRNLEKFY